MYTKNQSNRLIGSGRAYKIRKSDMLLALKLAFNRYSYSVLWDSVVVII
jgi:hypothetical protein